MVKEIGKPSWIEKQADKIYAALRIGGALFLANSAHFFSNKIIGNGNADIEVGKMVAAVAIGLLAIHFLVKSNKKPDTKKLAEETVSILTKNPSEKTIQTENPNLESLKKIAPLHMARTLPFFIDSGLKFAEERQGDFLAAAAGCMHSLANLNISEAGLQAFLAISNLNEIALNSCSLIGHVIIGKGDSSNTEDMEKRLETARNLFYASDGIAILSGGHDPALALAGLCFMLSSYLMKHMNGTKDIEKTDLMVQVRKKLLEGQKSPSTKTASSAAKMLSRHFANTHREIHRMLKDVVKDITSENLCYR